MNRKSKNEFSIDTGGIKTTASSNIFRQAISKIFKTDHIKVKISREIKYILLFFLVTRIILSLIGVWSREVLTEHHGIGMQNHSSNVWLNIWGVWDSGYYMYISQHGYSVFTATSDIVAKTSYAFFPLYPLLMNLGGVLVGDNFLAGVLISNISLLIASVFLYKLVRMDLDEVTALKSVKYLFLFPTAFVFSGVFTEALFLALAVISFYCARKERWFWAGMAGFLLALTRNLGVFIILPLCYEYLSKKDFDISKIKKDILFLLLIPFGFFLFSAYNYFLTGDFFAFLTVLSDKIWGRHLTNPLLIIYESFLTNNSFVLFNVSFVSSVIVVLLIMIKKISFSYWFFSMYSIIIPLLASDISHMTSMSRYILVAFPLFILFAVAGKENRRMDIFITTFFALLQVILMMFWTTGFYFTI